MSNELVPTEISSKKETVSLSIITASPKSYLNRLQLFGSKSDACAEGKIGIGRWGIVNGDEIVDLGPEIDVVVICYRPKALQIGDMITSFDVESELYNKIKNLSRVRDSGCMYGPEFLIWLPSENTFLTYHMSNISARREAEHKMDPLVGKAATFKIKLIDPPTSKHKWHGPVITPCSAALTVPPIEELVAISENFKNPQESEVELADDDDSKRER